MSSRPFQPNAESLAMRVARSLGMERVAWALRRLHCPVAKDALVLEVGSGGNPYARANVLLDAYEVTRERHWAALVSDRPTVIGFVENLPFKDKAFDFVIASHVLEHSTDPESFLRELQRVAKAGYIETPDAFMERINPYRDHRLEVTIRNGRLQIRKKPGWRTDPELVELYEQHAKPWVTKQLIPRHPFDFHVRYYWNDHIEYDRVGADQDMAWSAPQEAGHAHPPVRYVTLRQRIQNLLRSLQSQRARNANIDLISLMRCTQCREAALQRKGERLICTHCACTFEVRAGIPVMTAGASSHQKP